MDLKFEHSKYRSFFFVLLFPALAACASAQGYVEAGRRDLIFGDPNRAVVNFSRAAEIAPDRAHFSTFPEGALTYLGRAYYASGRLADARRTLEDAVSRYPNDNLAKLYLGLVLAREGDRVRGLRYIEDGLRGVHEWLDYIEYRHTHSYGGFWDPNKEIRSRIRKTLAMISSGQVDWPRLIAEAEWVGQHMEEEIDLARRDESDERSRDGDSPSRNRR
ncbi:MAG: tetratricopeptide repeat protein [Candidatus Binatia bacterium]